MFVRSNVSRQRCRLGRAISSSLSITRLSHPSDLRCRSTTIPPPSSSSPLARSISTRQPSRPRRELSSARTGSSTSTATTTTYLPDRSLATAVGDLPSQLWEIQKFDPSLPVILPEPIQPTSNLRTTVHGVPGDHELAVPVFDACVRVGKLDRAAMVLKRLTTVNTLDSEHLLQLNNQYLEACLRQLKSDPGVGKAEDLHAWYEVHIHDAALPQTPETIAYMLKASLLTTSSEGTRLTRLIKRYMGMVPPDQGLDVLYCTDILSDSDIAVITTHFPEFNVPTFDDGDGDGTDLPESADTTIDNKPDTVADHFNMVPKVLETPQKGSGLQAIQATLGVFNQLIDGQDISKLPIAERREFQARLERDCIDAAVARWRESDEQLRKMGLNTFLSSSNMNAKLWQWQQDLEQFFKAEFANCQAAELQEKKTKADVDRCLWGPIIMQTTPQRLAAVTILSTLNCLAFSGADKGVALSSVISHVSKVAEEDIQAHKRTDDVKAQLRRGKAEWVRQKARQREAAKDGGANVEASNANVEAEAVKDGDANVEALDASVETEVEASVPRLATPENATSRLRTWPISLRTKIGAMLLSGLAEVAKVRIVREHPVTGEKVASIQPALTHCHQFRRGRKVGVLIAHPKLAEAMRKEPRADFLARHLPMVVEPEPWTRFERGAYIESPVPIMRTKAGEQDQRLYAEAALARGDMEQVLKGLNVLGRTAWRINRPVFDIFLEAWNSGDAIAKVPALKPELPVPVEPEASSDPLARKNWLKAVKQAHNAKMSYHSIRCYMNFQLEIARAFRDQEFFFPHNIDFRGRAYPVPTYLNHMGADHVRGLLRFSKGKELGERGLMWLKVHLANVFGYDKASLKDREAFAMENLENVVDSANNPLGGKRWWLTAEDPWQCLAACFEVKGALECPDPTKYVSSLPVHQDGTCNGLQHYAALGGDTWGAKQVNLAPGDKPADVYSAVADLVREEVEQDAQIGNQIAKAMQGKVKRKVVKQTVMTNVYGVTFAGAKKQVLKQIDALYPGIEQETGVQSGLIASYITTKIFKALSSMFKGAHDIQYWLGDIGGRVCRALTAEQIAKIRDNEIQAAGQGVRAKKVVNKADLLDLCRSTIIWTTPLRMPVVQPYRKNNSKIIQTCLQSLILQNPNRFDPVNRRKQLQAFPPNFIHSLDASHMLLSALECNELGLTFAAVHDSFWTHAGDIDVMNRVLRDAFIRIHSEDVIQRLLSEFEARYKGGLFMAQLDRKSPAAAAILKWRISNRKKMNGRGELILEKERMDLLSSTDPSDRKKGKGMITPASLYEQFASESGADVVGEDMSGTTLGSMSEPAAGAETNDGDMVEGAIHDEEAAMGAMEGELGPPEANMDVEMAVTDVAGRQEAKEDADEFLEKYTKISHFQEKLTKPKKVPKKDSPKSYVSVWLPLSFPKVPEKGDFDVTQLRNSDYFFS